MMKIGNLLKCLHLTLAVQICEVCDSWMSNKIDTIELTTNIYFIKGFLPSFQQNHFLENQDFHVICEEMRSLAVLGIGKS